MYVLAGWDWMPTVHRLGGWLGVGWALHVTAFVLVCLHLLRDRREAAAAVLWIFIAWSFPVLGPLLYLSFGIDRIPAKGFAKHQHNQQFLAERRAREARALAHWQAVHEDASGVPEDGFVRELNLATEALAPDHPLMQGNEVRPLVSGDEAFPRMLESIRSARDHIHLQSFIIGNDATGREFLDALAEKADEGVEVRVLFDRFGSSRAVFGGLFRRYRRHPHLHVAGWTQANPLKRQFQVNLRNHRKVLIVDGRTAFTGGVNLSDANRTIDGRSPIRDYHFRCCGPIVQEIQFTFLRDWYFMTGESPDGLLTERYFPLLEPCGRSAVRMINGGPSSRQEVMADAFFLSIVSARRQVLAVTPYFVPNRDILRGLRSAALRGIDVRLIVPEKNNHYYAGMAGRALYEDLLDSGVRIFERPPPFIHAKALLVDGRCALIGTANMDIRSFRLNYESNFVVYDEHFVDVMKRIILEDESLSREIDLASWQRRPAYQRIQENLFSLMTPIL
ncbi:cardiolipin synthase [Kiritimatiella glycovorans]|uniref:Cardiolipin synthase n=1 Tax=Kiritimatiella glycovorans TaxID=1307763 RepID=A0A0G3EK23_9BACT|nr:cardiolipin synthase [Kiritimatiella glycovorans]AKJ64489.1 Major cardiolipin synthase ClsA [Kiritimatiella glycovorans]